MVSPPAVGIFASRLMVASHSIGWAGVTSSSQNKFNGSKRRVRSRPAL